MAIPTEPTLSTRIRTLSRSAGRNAPQMAAYISGTDIEPSDELRARLEAAREPREDGRALAPLGSFDYRARAWNVEFSELVLPAGAPEWARDRQTFWNRVEAAERGPKAQVAREFRFSFSYDLTADQRRELAEKIAARFAGMGMAVDVAVHRYGQKFAASDPRTAEQVGKWQAWGIPFVDAAKAATLDREHVRVTHRADGSIRDFRIFQPHAHCLMQTRPFSADGLGFGGKTDKREALGKGPDGKYRYRVTEKSQARQWNDQTAYEPLRGEIAAAQNAMLEANGSDRRIDARGYEVRRAEALGKAEAAKIAGLPEEAERQTVRAAQLKREPEPYLGVALRVKEFSERIRARISQWSAVRHRNRIQPQIDALWKRDQATFVPNALRMIQAARRHAGLERDPDLERDLYGRDGSSGASL